MKTNIISLLVTLLLAACAADKSNLTRHVDPYIGTGAHGHVFLGASVPFGFVQLGPTNVSSGWDWTSGYHVSDTTVVGFAHTHLSGTGIGDLGDIALLPVAGPLPLHRAGLVSTFRRVNERARPGYYATRLDRHGIDVELTATSRVGFHRYAYPADSLVAGLVIDLQNGIAWDKPVATRLARLDDRTVVGFRHSSGWASRQQLYFVATFSRDIRDMQISDGQQTLAVDSLTASRLIARLSFDNTPGTPLLVKVALSPVSIANAIDNLARELPGWNFERAVARADSAWNDQLSKIIIETPDSAVLRTFYTALYHTMIAPSEFHDLNGEYRGADHAVHRDTTFINHTTFSLWDTYRAAHPLATIIHPERVPHLVNTMLNIFLHQGKLPVWHLMGCETDCMVGNPAIPVVADAILKGYRGFDTRLALDAMKRSALLDERGLGLLRAYGYIPHDLYNESVATSLEYALADHALALAALSLGDTLTHDHFLARSRVYTRYFDPATGFMRGLSSDGRFREPLDPFDAAHRANDYTEGNAWQYTWLVPHDIPGLVALFGSPERFISKLDSLFIITGDMGANASPDITGLIGQYAHGNEPGHHIPYLHAVVGQPWKTAEHVRRVLTTLYSDRPDGLSGNEDVGQMSAWYILSALGFYQVSPAGGPYYFGSPLVHDATIRVRDGRTFRITARDNSPSNKYIHHVTLNGRPLSTPYITHSQITSGGHLVFHMSPTPNLPQPGD